VVARLVGTVGLIQLMRVFTHQPRISFKEQLFVCYAGLIRGAIAFGLVLRLSGHIKEKEKLDVIETTALTLVVSTTLIFGSTMSIMQKLLVPKLTKDEIN
jgi:NhaP-type Na+/H+ or K+/H+ antiporter